MSTDDLMHTAIHEAGHAVVQMRLCVGDVLGSLSIIGDDLTAGRLTSETRDASAEEAETAVMVLCGGYAALLVASHSEETSEAGADGDFEQAQAMIDFWGLAPLAEWKQRAVDLLVEPRNLHAVRAIAERLVADRHIEGDVLPVLLEHADGECSDEDLERFLAFRSPASKRA
jgi:hypothetical protein